MKNRAPAKVTLNKRVMCLGFMFDVAIEMRHVVPIGSIKPSIAYDGHIQLRISGKDKEGMTSSGALAYALV